MKPEPELDIRRAFHAVRSLSKCTYAELARKMGVDPRTIGRWIKGDVRVDIRMLDKLATASGIELLTIIAWMKGMNGAPWIERVPQHGDGCYCDECQERQGADRPRSWADLVAVVKGKS